MARVAWFGRGFRPVRRHRRWIGVVGALTLTASLAGANPALAGPAHAGPPPVHDVTPVKDVTTVKVKKIQVEDQTKRAFHAAPARWPAAVVATTALTAPAGKQPGAKAGAAGTPLWARTVAPKKGSYTGPSSLNVTMLAHQDATDLGLDGVVFTVGAAAGGTGPVQIGLNTASFVQAAGGNYASRLHLVQLPACALTTPQLPACRTQTPLATTHDSATDLSTTLNLTRPGTTSPTRTFAPAPTASSSAQDTFAAATVLAATASTDSGAGTYSATSLKPSGSWSSGGSSGSFSYSYPIDLPGSSGSLQPSADLSYNSGSVDGQTASTQAQASWAGDGWSTPDSFIEQTFTSCADDPEGTASPVATGDNCYAGPLLTLSLNGSSTSLVKDDTTGDWKPAADNGEVVKHVTNSGNGSGTYNTDYWTVTERNGDTYQFGRNQLPGWTSGKPTTNSVDTEPVYSAHSGDPCYDSAGFTSSVCTMAYRWHLDYVTDTHGEAMAYYYHQDTNYYGEDKGAHDVSYVRDSYLTRIDYGFRDGGAYGTVPDQVVFTSDKRCTLATCDALSTTTAPTQYPDVPYDLVCVQGTDCDQQSPSFFSTARLASITTKQWSATANDHLPVDTYTLHETEPATGDGNSPTLWLSSISHTGNHASPGGPANTVTLPDVKFTGIDLQNRVDTSSFPGLYRYRISSVTNEMGGITAVTYGLPEPCTATYVASASPSSNAKSCYPVSWTPKDYTAPITDWFEKYAATKIVQTDITGGAVAQETDYDYTGGAAWHYDDNEVVKAKYRTWGQFRGYGTVTTRTGDGTNDAQTKSVTTYYRGMDGDWLSSTSTRSVTLTDSQGGQHTDSDQLAGNTLETTNYLGDGGAVNDSTVTSYWISAATATRARTGVPDLTAHAVQAAETWARQALTDGGTTHWRYTETDTTYDASPSSATFAFPTHVYTHTVPAQADYDRCTSTTYAPANTAKNLVGLVSFEETDSVACSGFTENSTATVPKTLNSLSAPASVNRPAQVVSAAQNFYDDPTFSTTFPQAAAPTIGDLTMVRHASGYAAGSFTWITGSRSTFDAYGRATAAYDSNGNKTTTAYTLDSVGLTTAVTSTNAKNQSATTTLDPARSLTLTSTDVNGLVSTARYDTLGRTTAVWQDNRPTSAPADALYTYTVSQTSYSGITTQTLNNSLGYVTSTTLYDSLGRDRQTQTPTPQLGRLITESFYDSHGWVRKKNTAYWDKDHAPALEIAKGDNDEDSVIPDQDVYTFDGLGRVVVDDSLQYGVTKQTTTTVYNGDTTTVIPPDGGTVKSTTTDPLGRTTSVASYSTPPTLSKPADTFTGIWSISGGTSNAITYGYDGHGNQDTVASGGSTWSTTYDLLGRAISKSDPDAGTSTMVYDDNGNLTQTTDARGKSVSFVYDALNRKTSQYAAPLNAQASANQTASWVYDNDNGVANVTNAIGKLTTETSYSGGAAYVTQQTGFNAFGESLGETVNIPTTEGAALGRVWTFKHTYSANAGLPLTDNYPAAGGLPAQTVAHGYSTALDLPNSVADTSYTYAHDTTYSAYGQVLQETIGNSGNNAYLTNTYDPHTGAVKDQLLTRTITPAAIDDEAYDYDPAGNITRQTSTRLGATAATETQCYAYDHLDRLTSAWTATDSCAAAPTPGSHAQVGDQLTGGTAYWTSWTFDILGQRTSQTDHATTAGGTDTTTGYMYKGTGNGNTANQPHTLTGTQSTGATTASTAYTYDADGNTLTRNTAAGTQNLTWDDTGRLSQITATASGTTSYVYDADGNVLLQKDPGSTILYLPGQQITLNTATDTATGVRYLALPGGGTAVRTGLGTNYGFEFGDLHGTNGIRLDSTAQTPTWRQFTPYGDTRGTTVTWTDNRGFLDAPTNTNTGLTQLGARQYDPTLGRFISLDPLFEATDDQLLNGYTYTRDNPIGQADPSGLIPLGCGTEGACYGYSPQNGCPGGCGTTANQEWGKNHGQSPTHGGGCRPGSCGTSSGKPSANDIASIKRSEINHWSPPASNTQELLGWLWEGGNGNWGSGADYWEPQANIDGHMTNLCLGRTGCSRAYKYLLHHQDDLDGARAVAATYCLTHASECASDEQAQELTAVNVKGFVTALAFGVFSYSGGGGGQGGSGGGGGGCSFDPDTPVLMDGGKTTPISKIKPGEKVEAGDPVTGKHEGPHSVTATWINHDANLLDVIVKGPEGQLATLHTTANHPFWDNTTHAWTAAGKLQVGHNLNTQTDRNAVVSALRRIPSPARNMYNLTVQDLHTYYVLAGHTPVLVHNSDGCPTGRLSSPLPDGMNNKIASAYDDVRAGRIPSHATYKGREYSWWAGSKEYRVPGRPDTDRILEKELPNGVKVYGWTSTHYAKIQRFSAPHFPDSGWN
ncbi:polymorphic toxin-type HINT domain-containing protein [Actinacidiphila epipremni]|uniref:Sugar-binding protein n=1 Tax=Actinacidiphila epipremni TaxID=2053013 RepID=A0ABX0ZQ23_9ACTN|nr:polymorphic toxin-type HINT domain-containing protein [Actinacidiphila epipremni]NJP44756.1 sugar-binding protein [Actinacidiphila epipremni]